MKVINHLLFLFTIFILFDKVFSLNHSVGNDIDSTEDLNLKNPLPNDKSKPVKNEKFMYSFKELNKKPETRFEKMKSKTSYMINSIINKMNVFSSNKTNENKINDEQKGHNVKTIISVSLVMVFILWYCHRVSNYNKSKTNVNIYIKNDRYCLNKNMSNCNGMSERYYDNNSYLEESRTEISPYENLASSANNLNSQAINEKPLQKKSKRLSFFPKRKRKNSNDNSNLFNYAYV